MDISMKLEQVRDICDHFVEKLEQKLDDVGIGLSETDSDDIRELVLSIVEHDLASI